MVHSNAIAILSSISSSPMSTPPGSPELNQMARELAEEVNRKLNAKANKASLAASRVNKRRSARNASRKNSDAEVQDTSTQHTGSGIRSITRSSTSSRTLSASSSSASPQKSPNLDTTEGFMPSADNGFKFEYDSYSGRTAMKLDSLLSPPARVKADHGGGFSYSHFGEPPRTGLADDLVLEMEAQQIRENKKYEMEEKALGTWVDDFWVDLCEDSKKWTEEQRRQDLL